MSGFDIVVVGSTNMDMAFCVDRLPEKGETVIGGEYLTAFGGKGANQAVAAARLGAKVAFVGKVGKDKLGDEAIQNFKKNRIDIRHLTRHPKASSGVAGIFVGKDTNQIVVASGANLELKPADVQRAAPSTIRKAKMLVLQLEVPLNTVVKAAEIAHKAGVEVLLNPAPAAKLPKKLLNKVKYIVPNEVECEMLLNFKPGNKKDYLKACDMLLKLGPEVAIVTMGKHGVAYCAKSGEKGAIPAIKVKPYDTTAAGDAFVGAFAAAMVKGNKLEDALRFANVAAGLSVTKAGAQPSLPSLKSVKARLGN